MAASHPTWVRLFALILSAVIFAVSLVPTVSAPVNGRLSIARLRATFATGDVASNGSFVPGTIDLDTNFGVFGGCAGLAYKPVATKGGPWAESGGAGIQCSKSDAGYAATILVPTWVDGATGSASGIRYHRVDLITSSQSRPLNINVVLNIWTGLMMLWTPFVIFSTATWRRTALSIQLFMCLVFAWAAFGLNITLRSKLAGNVAYYKSLPNAIQFAPLVGEGTWCSLANALLLTITLPLYMIHLLHQSRAAAAGSAASALAEAQEMEDLDVKVI